MGIVIVSKWISLFKQPRYKPQAFPRLELLFTVAFALSCVAVASVFSVIQWHNRPLTLQTRTISNHSFLASLPADYVCDCSLPAYLEGVRSVQNANTSTHAHEPARCYRKDALQTVTVVQFSNSTASYLPEVLLPLSGSSVQPRFRAFHNGFNVTQSPVELDLWQGNLSSTLLSRIFRLPLLEGTGLLDLPVDGILGALYFDFPRGYMRMAFRYWCTNCSYCGLDKLLDLPGFAGMDVKAWAFCDGWGRYGDNCLRPDPLARLPGYEGRCNIYPTYDVPMAARLKQFLRTFKYMPYINFTASTRKVPEPHGKIDLELNLLNVNVSHFTENVPIMYGFLEVDKLSSAWSELSETFPGIGNSCRENATIEICNGTSFCNAFKTSADLGSSSVSFSCIDFRHDYSTCLQLAINSGNSALNETLCPQNFRCRNVPQYSVMYNLEGENSDNRLLAGRMNQSFNNTYAWGVCSNTYENVVRIKGDELWATECTDSGLCHLTGRYNSPNDASWEESKSSADLGNYTTPLYICYAARKQRVLPWGISTVGLMSGWFSGVLVGVQCLYFVVDWVAQRISRARSSSHSEGAGVDAETCQKESSQTPGAQQQLAADQEVELAASPSCIKASESWEPFLPGSIPRSS